MKGGKIVISGFLEEHVLTFTIDSRKPKVKIDEGDSATGPFYVFLGDLAEKGNGKLVVSKTNNPHLKTYENTFRKSIGSKHSDEPYVLHRNRVKNYGY